MLEEKYDSLHEADGNSDTVSKSAEKFENQLVTEEKIVEMEESESVVAAQTPKVKVDETESETIEIEQFEAAIAMENSNK